MLALIVFLVAAVLELVGELPVSHWFWLYLGLTAAFVSVPFGPTWVRRS